MALQGSLKTVRVRRCSRASPASKTGVLSVVSELEERAFLFYKGASSTQPPGQHEKARDVLVRLGFIKQEDLDREAAAPGNTELYFGSVSSRRAASRRSSEPQPSGNRCSTSSRRWCLERGSLPLRRQRASVAIPDGVPCPPIPSCSRPRGEPMKRITSRTSSRISTSSWSEMRQRQESLDPEAAAILSKVDGVRTVEHVLFASPKTSAAWPRCSTPDGNGPLRQGGVQPPCEARKAVPELYCFRLAERSGKAVRRLQPEDSQLPKLCEILRQDPMLTAKVLRAALSRRIDLPARLSIEQIVTRLGTFALRSTLIPEALRGSSSPSTVLLERVVGHSVVVAQLSARSRDGPVSFPEEAYMAALLHNLGAYVLMNNTEGYQRVVYEAMNNHRILRSWKKSRLASPHEGRAVYAEKWSYLVP